MENETYWAAVNQQGGIIHISRLRSEVIGYTAQQFDQACYDAARERAKKGFVFTNHKATELDRKTWKRLRVKYGIRAVKVTINEATS